MNKIKWDIYKILILIFSLSLLTLIGFAFNHNTILEGEKTVISILEQINQATQRISKLQLEGNNDDALTYEVIENMKILEIFMENPKYFTHDDRIPRIIKEFSEKITLFNNQVIKFNEEGDRLEFFYISENNYQITQVTINEVHAYVEKTNDYTENIEKFLVANICIIGVLLIIILINTTKALKINKELSEGMFIDTSTGLYNRSKCQEILKTPIDSDDSKERAVIIFDLNDLKKTNDGLGHRAGDDLISSFAKQLKEATNVFPYEIFVGRYGGDEFMAYFSSCEEKDVKIYLKEVDYLMEQFNDSEQKQFKLSCAAGYCITTAETKSMKMRELFDLADENMYRNKLIMKEKKKQEI